MKYKITIYADSNIKIQAEDFRSIEEARDLLCKRWFTAICTPVYIIEECSADGYRIKEKGRIIETNEERSLIIDDIY